MNLYNFHLKRDKGASVDGWLCEWPESHKTAQKWVTIWQPLIFFTLNTITYLFTMHEIHWKLAASFFSKEGKKRNFLTFYFEWEEKEERFFLLPNFQITLLFYSDPSEGRKGRKKVIKWKQQQELENFDRQTDKLQTSGHFEPAHLRAIKLSIGNRAETKQTSK